MQLQIQEMARTATWGQKKTTRHFRLTDTGHKGLGKIAQPLGITRNELLERLGQTATDEEKLQALLGVLTIALVQPHNKTGMSQKDK